MRLPSPRARARAAGLLLVAASLLPASTLAVAAPTGEAGALPTAATSAEAGARSVAVAVRDLPPGRRTLGRIAAYYYGAPEMSFVLTAANPLLAGFGPDRRLPVSGPRSVVRLPVLRGPRAPGPR